MNGLHPADTALVLSCAVALGAGLLIGIERERRKGEGPERDFAGVRTFAMAALMGTVTQALNHPLLVVVAGLLLLALCGVHYARERSADPGITTELALFSTFLLGVHAMERPRFTAAAAVVVAALLLGRRALHRFSTELLTPVELRDALILAGAALIVLPLLPARASPWLGGLDPQRLWALAVLFMAIQAAGHVGLRVLGAKLGIAFGALVGGFISSAATIAALGAKVRQTPDLLRLAVAGAWCSTVATVCQLGLVTLTLNPAALPLVLPCLLSMITAAVLLAGIGLHTGKHVPAMPPPAHAFHVPGSLGFAALLASVTAGVSFIAQHFGHDSVMWSVALSGFADAHAATASALSLAASGRLDERSVVHAMLFAISTNSLSKMGLAFASGGRVYGAITSTGLGLILLAAWVPALL